MTDTVLPDLPETLGFELDAPAAPPSPSDAQMSRLKVESLLLTAVYGVNALVGVAFWAVAARTLSVTQVGANTAIISAFTAAAVVAATGMANAFLAMVPLAGRAQGAILRYGYSLAIGTCLLTGAAAGTIAVTVVHGIGHPLWTMLGITVMSAVWGVFVIQDSVLVAFDKARWLLYENLPVSIVKLGLLPLFAVLMGHSAHPVVFATAAPTIVASLLVSGVVLPRLIRRSRADRAADADADPTTVEQWMATHRREFQLFALRDGAASAMNLGLFMFLPFLVTAAAGFREGGVFALSLQVSNAMDLFTVGVGISLTTTVASDHAAGPAAARLMWKRLARIVAAVAVVVIAGSPLVLRAFGPEYQHRGWEVVAILAVGALLRTTFEVWTALLRALRRTSLLLAWTSITAVTLFVSVIVGAHLGGALGGAIGVSGAAVLASAIGGLGLLGRLDGAKRWWVIGKPDVHPDWPWQGLDPAPLEGVVETATFFGGADRPRYGWLSRPDTGVASLGVVICPPVGEEARSAHRTLRRLGSELARRGIVALRVDYDGTGDSAGGQREPGRLDAWRASILDAADELRSMGLPSVAVVGMRLGATLAADVASQAGFESVVLWDPCTTGRSFLREGEALLKLTDYHVVPSDDGDVETPGFAYDRDTVAELRTLTMASLPRDPWCDRLLVLTRTGRPIAGAAGAGLGGSHVQWAEASGQERLVGVEPNEARTPFPVLDGIVDWLAVAAAGSTPVVVEPHVRTEVRLTDPRSGRPVRERIVRLGPHQLFGIVSEPVDPRPGTPWIALVNVAVEYHIGPGRRWVDFARSWAALGLRCVRFDQSGLGDSPVRPGQREDRLFDPMWLQDVPEVLDAVEAMSGDGAPLAVFGLCSGAYSAFEATMRRDIDAAYGVSLRLSIPQFGRGQVAYSPDRLAAKPFVRSLARLYLRDTRAAWGLWRLYYQVAVWHAPMAAIHRILRRGTTVRILASRKDAEGYLEALWWSLVRRRSITRTRRFSLRVEPKLEHALMTQWSQDIAYDDATRFWLDRYGVGDGPAPRG